MENLKLKDIDQSKEHTRGNQLNLLRGQNNKMMGGQVDQVKDDWNQVQLVAVNPEVVIDNKQKCHRRMTDKGREYRKTVLNRDGSGLVLRITR